MKRLSLALLLLTLVVPAHAQQNAQVIGPITVGHCPVFNSPTVIKDSGLSCVGGAGGIVFGPASSVVGNFAEWNNTTGSLLQDVTPTAAIDQLCATDANGLIRSGTWQCNGGFNSINVMSPPYNAKCDGSTDDTAAIASAIAATPSGGTLALPNGKSCLVSQSSASTPVFTLTNPINIVGQGSSVGGVGSIILVKSGTPTSSDIFHVIGIANATTRGFTFSNFSVNSQSGSVGQHILDFDTTASNTTELAEIIVTNVTFDPNASAGGYSVYLQNGSGNSIGGEFNVTLQNSFFGGGISCVNCGDSIRVLNNLIHTGNAGVTIEQILGGGNFIVRHNNISGTAGCVVMSSAYSPVIDANECEQQATNTETNNSMVDLTGTVNNITSPTISNNQIHSGTGLGNPLLLRMAAVTGGVVEGNTLGGAGTGTQLTITSAAAGIEVGGGNAYLGSGTAQSINGGSTTIYDPISKGTASSLVGNPTGGKTAPTDITLGSGLSFSGTTLICNTATSSVVGCLNLSNPTFSGSISSTGTAPTCAATGIGSTGTCTLGAGSNDLAGRIILTVGGSGISDTGAITLTLNASLGANIAGCILQAQSGTGTWTPPVTFINTTLSQTAPVFSWTNASTNLTTSDTYGVGYSCIGY